MAISGSTQSKCSKLQMYLIRLCPVVCAGHAGPHVSRKENYTRYGSCMLRGRSSGLHAARVLCGGSHARQGCHVCFE
eukprot:47702-Eustigmatos_ZCMA.PRE.1